MAKVSRNQRLSVRVVRVKDAEIHEVKKALQEEMAKKERKIKELEYLKRYGIVNNADVIDTQSGGGARHKGTTGKKKKKK